MNKYILFSLFFVASLSQLFAQEKLVPLQVNPTLIEQHGFVKPNNTARTQQTNNYTYYLTDTLGLPFIDDFSHNYLGWYNKDYFPASAITQTTFYKYKFNGIVVDTVKCNLDTAFNYTFDIANHVAIKYPKPSIGNLAFYSFPGYGYDFTTADSVHTVWPAYYLPTDWDSITGVLLDSELVLNKFVEDTFIVDVVDMTPLKGKWLDSDVFINDDFAINPVTVGVATFDGLDSIGMPYNINVPTSYGVADYLTSKPIDLSGKVAADSVYLTFHIQQSGNGNIPQVNDSFVVEFYAPSQKVWHYIWKKLSSYPTADNNWYFIPLAVKDTAYLQHGFMFRFKNYATLSGTFDHWNIDYVKLDENRNDHDNSYDDVAFQNKQESALNGYTATTFNQYTTSMLKTSFSNRIVNLNKTIPKNTQYHNEVFDNEGDLLYSSVPSSANMYAGEVNGCQALPPPSTALTCGGMIAPPINYSHIIPDTSVCRYYKIQQILQTTPEEVGTNDTITFIQHISNYISYDDGTAEAGYGLNTQYGKIAYKFNLSAAEVLTAVRFYFTPMLLDVTTKEFKITIWSDAGGIPGDTLYQQSAVVSPLYGYSQNNFREYTIPSLSLPAGIFYVGWQQETADKLYLGFDVNTNSSSNMFYNVTGQWNGSIYSGSWMIRPVFGTCPFETVGITETKVSEEILSIYPNPAQHQFFVHSKNDAENEKINLQLFDITGKIILQKQVVKNEAIAIDDLAKGIYLVKLKAESSTKYYTQKLIIE